jgi:purine-binding chemotaxis protein CheW
MVAFSPLSGGPEIVLGAINLHGRVVPVFDLRRRIGFPEREYGPDVHLLVARAKQRVVALPVDEVTGVRCVATDSLTTAEDVAPGLARVRGVAAVEDGILVIHDLDAFLSCAEEMELDRALEKVTV